MVANCCICKSHQGQGEDVTFHKIPRNENLANEWIKIISRIEISITKTATVCSKHFEHNQFQYKIVGSVIKIFLIPNAIPTKYVAAPLYPSNGDEETERKANDDMEDVMVTKSVFTALVNDEAEDGNSTLSKRNDDAAANINKKRARVKTIRYIGDLGREDFTSDEAHDVVKSYVSGCKNEIKTLKQKVRRLGTKIRTIKDLTDGLRSNNILTSQAVEFLQVNTLIRKS